VSNGQGARSFNRVLGFGWDLLGPSRRSTVLNGARVVPMRLDLDKLEKTYRERYGGRTTRNLHHYFFGEYQPWVTVQIAADLEELEAWGTSTYVRQLLEAATEAETDALEITTQRIDPQAMDGPRRGESEVWMGLDSGSPANNLG